MVHKGNYEDTIFALNLNPEMEILNDGDLFFSEGFIKVISRDNLIINRLQLKMEDKLLGLFYYYKDEDKLDKLLPLLHSETIHDIYQRFKDKMIEDDQANLFNSMKLTQMMKFLYSLDNDIDQESMINLLNDK